MSGNSFGKSFVVTTFGESHGVALGCVIDGCPPGLSLCEDDIQKELDKRKPGSSKYTTQRKEDDLVEILSGVFEGQTTGTPIGLLIRNKDQKSKDYDDLKDVLGLLMLIMYIQRNMDLEIIEEEGDRLQEKRRCVLLQERLQKNI